MEEIVDGDGVGRWVKMIGFGERSIMERVGAKSCATRLNHHEF
jgi:hypothetical protein